MINNGSAKKMNKKRKENQEKHICKNSFDAFEEKEARFYFHYLS